MEMDEFRQYVKDKLDNLDKDTGQIDTKLNLISEQVKATNGRVKNLEVWKAYITGGIAVFTVMMAPVIIQVMSAIFTHGLKLGG